MRRRLFSSRSNGVGTAEPAAASGIPIAKAVSSGEKSEKASLDLYETPSEALISALRGRGFKVDIAEPISHLVDLSWVDPNKITDKQHRSKLCAHRHQGCRKAAVRPSYATIVASYIRYVDPYISTENLAQYNNTFSLQALDVSILRVFDDRTMLYLSQRGYSASDVMTWAWILLSKDPFNAAMRLTAAKSGTRNIPASRIPLFVLLFTLRRRNIGLEALRLLITQAWSMLNTQSRSPLSGEQPEKGTAQQSWTRSGDDASMIILFVRLLRAARLTSPDLLLVISHLFTKAFGQNTFASPPKDKQTRRLITYYNKFLTLLAVPCPVKPYLSTLVQQRCIFLVLREMTKFDPPLQVTREGYHAVTRIHAARKKLPEERQWAEFKAKSWPPWKEDKLGIDVDRGLEGSRSKTLGSIARMKEAGYSPTRWDKIATILAGWDTDGTPTIQTRAFLPKPNPYRMRDQHTTWLEANLQKGIGVANSSNIRHEDMYPDVWAARIRATRTMKEAWACYLSCQDQGLQITNDIYYELTEKVIYHDYLQGSSQPPSGGELPGDGKEVYPEPSSPRDVIYVRSDPPSLDVLIRDILSRKSTIRKRLLELLLTHSPSFQTGLECLVHSDLQKHQIEALMTTFEYTDKTRKSLVECIPHRIFAAFICFLGKFSGVRRTSREDSRISLSQSFPIAIPSSTSLHVSMSPGAKITANNSLAHAVFLMRIRVPEYRPAWRYLLASLANIRLSSGNPYLSLSAQRLVAWKEIREAAHWMDQANIKMDSDCLRVLCEGFARLLLAARRDRRSTEQGLEFLRQFERTSAPRSLFWWPSTLPKIIDSGAEYLKEKYDEVVLSTSGPAFPRSKNCIFSYPSNSSLLPRVSAMPKPSTLHAFIRVLGLGMDYGGVLHLLEWMSRNASELKRVSKEQLGGSGSLRRAVVAARVYLEKSQPKMDNGNSFAPDEVRDDILDHHTPPGSTEESEKVFESSKFDADYYLQKALAIVEGSELLSPWPTDEEVHDYVAEHKGGF